MIRTVQNQKTKAMFRYTDDMVLLVTPLKFTISSGRLLDVPKDTAKQKSGSLCGEGNRD